MGNEPRQEQTRILRISWSNIGDISSQNYTCWNCGSPLASDKGWNGTAQESVDGEINLHRAYVCVCHFCSRPTFIEVDGKQIPGIPFGSHVQHIPDKSVSQLYEEARRAAQARSYTAAVLCCRKLLMHIAVSKGAPTEQNFASYVQYLADKRYISPEAIEWVDHIRNKANEANHEINIMSEDDAKELIVFSEMLLKTIYEFPTKIKRPKSGPL